MKIPGEFKPIRTHSFIVREFRRIVIVMSLFSSGASFIYLLLIQIVSPRLAVHPWIIMLVGLVSFLLARRSRVNAAAVVLIFGIFLIVILNPLFEPGQLSEGLGGYLLMTGYVYLILASMIGLLIGKRALVAVILIASADLVILASLGGTPGGPYRMDWELAFTLLMGGGVLLFIQYSVERFLANFARAALRARSERNLAKAALLEKEALLREVHHRVKNNLQVVTSLLNIQAMADDDERLHGLVKTARTRIRSMALVHEKLYQERNTGAIDFGGYAESLFRELLASFGRSDVLFDNKLAGLELPLDLAVNLGLLLNEIFTNSLRHGLHGRSGTVSALCEECDGRLILCLGDDGIWQEPAPMSAGIGMKLVETLAQQVGGLLERDTSRGTRYRISLPPPPKN